MTRRIVESPKDAKGSYLPPEGAPRSETPSDPLPKDINLDDLISKHLLILYRETRSLMVESASGKLSKDSAISMRDNMRLLFELKKKERELLDNLTDEDIVKLLNDQLKKP